MDVQFIEVDSDETLCQNYALFASKLTQTEANIIFWLLSAFVLLLLCVSLRQYYRSASLSDVESGHVRAELNLACRKARIQNLREKRLGVVVMCLMLSLVCVVLEAFEAISIEYCYDSDFVMLYWCFWSLTQVGSIIAMCALMLRFWILLANVEMPWWAFALRTPVLVFAALKSVWDRVTRRCLCSRGEIERRGEKRAPPQVMIEIGKGNMGIDESDYSKSSMRDLSRQGEGSGSGGCPPSLFQQELSRDETLESPR